MDEKTLAIIDELTREIAALKQRVEELETPTEPANPFIPQLGATNPRHDELAAIYGGRS